MNDRDFMVFLRACRFQVFFRMLVCVCYIALFIGIGARMGRERNGCSGMSNLIGLKTKRECERFDSPC